MISPKTFNDTSNTYIKGRRSCSYMIQGDKEPGAIMGLGKEKKMMFFIGLTICANAHGFIPLQRIVAVLLLHAHS